MTHVYLATAIRYLRGRKTGRFSSLALAAGIIGFGTLSSALAQTRDIRSYGARCDGSDDSGAINAAFNSLPNGATLQLNCQLGIGSSGVLLHNKQGVIIDGAGGNIVGLSTNPAKILIRVEVCDNCTIRNLTINANNVGAAGVSIYWSNNSSIENTTVTSVGYPAYAGIVGMGNRGNRYVNNTVAGTTGNGSDGTRGIWVGNPDSPLLDYNPVVANNSVRDIAATGIVLHTVGGTVTGNTIDRTQGSGIKVEPPPGAGGQIVVQGNTVRNNLFSGVQVYRAECPVLIQNNTISSNTISGIYSSGGAFVNGRISGNTITGNGQGGLFLYDARNVVIEGNQITSGGNGIVFEAGSSSALGGVQVSSNTISGANADGIVVRGRGGSFSGLSLNSNSIMNNRRYGLVIEESNASAVSNVSLNGNCFSGNGVGPVFDLRTSNAIGGVSSSSSCSTTSLQQSSPITTPSAPVIATPIPVPAPAPTPIPVPAPTPAPAPSVMSAVPLKVNAGSGQYIQPNGEVWLADFGYAGGNTTTTSNQISNTSHPGVYQSWRWADAIDYSFQVPSGSRTVILKFAEAELSSRGQRVFDVVINGQTVMSNYDVFAVAGANTAHDRSFVVQTTGAISIHIVGRVGRPMISGIEIR